MTEEEFIQRFFAIAGEIGLKIKNRRPGKSICFNQKSDKWLDEVHLRRLYDGGVLNSYRTDKELNELVASVAPGRPCTHVGCRTIIRRLQLECGGVTVVGS